MIAEPATGLVGLSPSACYGCGGTRWHHLFTDKGYDLVECDDCGLAYLANPPKPEEVAALYVADDAYHGALADEEDATVAMMRRTARQHLRFLRKNVADPAGMTLLDVGCSTGLFLDEARRAGFVVSGVEISPKSGGVARDRLGLDVHIGDWRTAGYADAQFDVITLLDLIEHLPDPIGELVALRRLLKPGGILLQSTPDIDGLFPRVSHRFAKALGYWPHPEAPYHLFQFSKRTLTELTRRAGYMPLRADQTRIWLDYTFGTPETWRISPKMMAYALAFAPIAYIAPWVGRGDWLYLAATPNF